MNDQTTAPAEETKAPAVPRGPSPENQARLDYITQRTESEPGVRSTAIAKELGITTLSCGQLADRLVRKGDIQLVKIAGGIRTYYPKGYDVSTVPTEAPEEAPKEAKKKSGGKKKAAEPAA